jgi:trimethylamine--corrinoid protein Co-methyltransferase
MQAQIQVLCPEELCEVHGRSLRILMDTGVRVDSSRARKILSEAGAQVDNKNDVVRFPPSLVENALKSAPKDFILGGRRPGWNFPVNHGDCTLAADGEALWVVNADTGERRPGTEADWLKATQLIDALDEIGVYWQMISNPSDQETMDRKVRYWRNTFTQFSKHIQDSTENVEQTRWLLELLQIIFGNRDTLKQIKPFSFLLCPVSPLVIEENFTDAYLETIGMELPVAVMPMPILGLTSPARLIATTVQGNCETLAMLCLVQAAAPGTPFIYAPALALADLRTGRYTGGAIEHSLLSVSVTQMARYYHLPVEASTGGANGSTPGIKTSYERTINWTLPTLAWPDILVGPGLFAGSTVLCYEQLYLDVEVFRSLKRLHQGIRSEDDQWLLDVIAEAGPGGNFLKHRSTLDGLRSGVWHISNLDRMNEMQETHILEYVRAQIEEILKAHQPLPLDEDTEKELDRLEARVHAAEITHGD